MASFVSAVSVHRQTRTVWIFINYEYMLVLVLGASNIRLVIENWMKYGLLIRLPHSYIPYQDYGLFVLAWLSVPLSLALTLLVEIGLSRLAVMTRDNKNDFRSKVAIIQRLASIVHVSHLTFLLSYPSYIVYTKIYHPLGKCKRYIAC